MNALVFSSTNFFLSKLMDHSEREHKRHNLTLQKFQRAEIKLNELILSMKNFVKRDEATAYFNSVDKIMIEYY